jgi:hypothetical protein
MSCSYVREDSKSNISKILGVSFVDRKIVDSYYDYGGTLTGSDGYEVEIFMFDSSEIDFISTHYLSWNIYKMDDWISHDWRECSIDLFSDFTLFQMGYSESVQSYMHMLYKRIKDGEKDIYYTFSGLSLDKSNHFTEIKLLVVDIKKAMIFYINYY